MPYTMKRSRQYPNSTRAAKQWWPFWGLGFIAALTALSACGDDLLTDPRQIVFPDKNVSYINHVQPFLHLSCTYSGCHSSESRAADIDFTAYFEFISKPGLVVEGTPESSVLAQVVDNKLPHRESFQSRITANHIQGIKTWIAEGAKNN